MAKLQRPTEEMVALLKATASNNRDEAVTAAELLVAALQGPLRQGTLVGPILEGIYQQEPHDPGSPVDYPIDFISPGTEKDFVAYVLSTHGMIPERTVEGDYVRVPTFMVGHSLDWNIKYNRDAKWNIMKRGMEVMEAGFIKKNNDDGFRTLLSAGMDRNIMVYDADASNGQFTKRLVSSGKIVMRRNGGGNSTSVNRGKLTHIFMSPEGQEDMRNWNLDQVDDVTRRNLYTMPDESLNEVFNVRLVPLDELGEGQEYQSFFLNQLGGTLAAGDVELAVGLDLEKNDSFINPIVEEVSLFADDMHRRRKFGLYGWMEHGWGVLDNRRVLLFSY